MTITSGLTNASISTLSSICASIIRLRSSWPSGAPGMPRATMRWKCTDTPSGASAIISVSTVGLPGGTRKPSRARQPIILFSFVPMHPPANAAARATVSTRGALDSCLRGNDARNACRLSDRNLAADLDNRIVRHPVEFGDACRVALHRREQRLDKARHLPVVLARDDGLVADVVGHVGQVDIAMRGGSLPEQLRQVGPL